MDILLATFTTLLSVVNPFGAMPVFLSLTDNDTAAETIEASREKDDISFTPLAMPMLSGPGAIAVCISLYTKKLTYFDMGLIFVGFVLVALAAYIILMSSLRLTRFLGRPGLAALARIMGFITLAIGVNFIMTAIKALFVS